MNSVVLQCRLVLPIMVNIVYTKYYVSMDAWSVLVFVCVGRFVTTMKPLKVKKLTNSATHLCSHHLVSQMVLDNIQYHTCTLPGYQQVMNLILDMDDTSQCYYERT